MNRRRLTYVRERPRPRGLEIVCAIVFFAIVYLLAAPVLGWISQAGGAQQGRDGGYTIIEQ